MTRNTRPVPEAVAQLQQRLEQYRSTQARRSKLPEELWQTAVRLARQHGVYSVAHTLRLDYMGLKKRLGGLPSPRRKATKPAFVELMKPQLTKLDECVIEFESSRGAKMRIQWKAGVPPDWASLLRAWREVEG